MKAAQLVAPRTWRIIEVEKPEAVPGKMLVRLERVAICGSDKPSFCGLAAYPLPPGSTGHEGMGRVESCPSGAYEKGERVLLWGFDRGLFQEYVLAPDQGGCIRLPGELPPETALMSQLLGTVIHSFYKLGNILGHKVVVLGQGPVGQLFDAVLRNLGARQIIAVDPLDYRLEVARTMGATHTLNPSSCDLAARVAEITGGEMADLVVEAVGEEESFNLCVELARRNAQVICFGIPDKGNRQGLVKLRFLEIYRKELRLITSVGPNPSRDYAPALEWILQGRIDVRPILTHVLPFEQIQQGFEMAFEDPATPRSIKIVLSF